MKRKTVLLIAAVIVLIAVVTVGGYGCYLMNRVHYVNSDTSPTLTQQELDNLLAEETIPQIGSTEPTVHWKKARMPIVKEDRVINILLIGQDRRAGETRARSDAMILCTFHTGSNTLTMTSFMRDLWVQIPGYQDNKLNAAYVAGGMKLLDRTLEENFGVQIDGNVEVDFQQFIQIIDLLGGVEIELRADEAKYLNRALDSKDLSSGPQTLTGQQALCYARIRSLDPDADFSRTSRQRKVMEALIQKYRSAGTKTALSLLDDILPMVTTDMTKVQIAGYARDLLPELSSMRIVSQRIPAEGTFTTPVIRNMSVLLADMDAARKMLQQTLQP